MPITYGIYINKRICRLAWGVRKNRAQLLCAGKDIGCSTDRKDMECSCECSIATKKECKE